MPQYRIERKLKNGWNIRLEMLAYDTNLGDAITALGDVCLLELSEQTAEFDGLPHGLVKPQTLKFKLAWNLIPGAMQTYIENSPDGDKSNLWMLFSDRGTNGATYSLEYCGVEDNVEAVNLEPLDNGTYAYTVELVDMTYHAMKTATGRSIFSGKIGGHWPQEQKVYQFLLRSYEGRNQIHQTVGRIEADTFANIFGHIKTGMATRIKTNYARTTSTSVALFDSTDQTKKLISTAIELYKIDQLNVAPRGLGDAVTENTAYLTTNVYAPVYAGATIGGLYSRSDNYGWGRSDTSIYDVMRDLCETLGVKASYYWQLTTVSGVQKIDTIWIVKRIGNSLTGNLTNELPDVVLSIDDALALPNVIKRGDNISKAEVRYETSNSEDATEIVRIQNGARSSRSMNVEPIIHNIPVFMKDYDDFLGRSETYKQTNQILFADTNKSLVKVHETTKYWYGPAANQWVKISSTASDKPEFQDDESQEKYRIQLAAMQTQTGMAAALCLLHLHVFANNANATAEMEWNYTHSAYVRPQGLCGRHELQDNVADTFTTIKWDTALPTSIVMDWVGGTSKIKYYMLAPTTSKEVTS